MMRGAIQFLTGTDHLYHLDHLSHGDDHVHGNLHLVHCDHCDGCDDHVLCYDILDDKGGYTIPHW